MQKAIGTRARTAEKLNIPRKHPSGRPKSCAPQSTEDSSQKEGWLAEKARKLVDRRGERELDRAINNPRVKIMVTYTSRSLIGRSIGGRLVVTRPPPRPKRP
jgi:hypothetical protein